MMVDDSLGGWLVRNGLVLSWKPELNFETPDLLELDFLETVRDTRA